MPAPPPPHTFTSSFLLPSFPSFPSSSRPTLLPTRAPMSSAASSSLPPPPPAPPPAQRVVLGCGGLGLDFLVTVNGYPNPDDKIRSTTSLAQGGGNAGNALTAAARLGLAPRLVSKLADDAQGKGILAELDRDGVDTSYIVMSKGGNSPFTYVIVDEQTKTRACIHTPGHPPMVLDDFPSLAVLAALDGVRLVYSDFRLHETALVIAKEAVHKGIPILVDAERKREGLDELISMATYVVCSANFPMAWTGASSLPSALVSTLLRLPNIKFVVVTLGEDGCLMLERSSYESEQPREVDVDDVTASLKKRIDTDSVEPVCISTESAMKLKAAGIGTVCGNLYLGTAEKIPPSELVDTTGAGDAFIGAVLYAICAEMAPEKMLPFAALVAGAKCRALGARTGLPHRNHPRLASFFI